MELIVTARAGETRGWAELDGERYRCALGRSGILMDKREGDGGTPVGRFPVRRLLYRADRLANAGMDAALAGSSPVATALPQRELQKQDGWCDDPADAAYNQPVTLPYAGRHEMMWRDDHLYDLVLVIGHNDAPVIPDHGSAVFIHLAQPDYRPTEGCIAFARIDLEAILAKLAPGDHVRVDLI
jgi:L,D-peptidoglycan transpeptidase YkuD (ErfK/YbiS/YcfS/YnhG family)